MIKRSRSWIGAFVALSLGAWLAVGCAPATSSEQPEASGVIGVVIDTGGELDRSFNQYTLEGARRAAAELGYDVVTASPETTNEFSEPISRVIEAGATMVVTVGFRQGVATAQAARTYPDIHFAIVDTAYFPGEGCAITVDDCYSPEGGLTNVTSLLFAEDEVAYLAGVLAACMSETGTIASVGGIEIPPVVRFIEGYAAGARSFDPAIVVLNSYLPDFNDPPRGEVTAQSFINQGADVVFAAAGNSGNGALLATHNAQHMAIGVDVDQYFSYPEVAPSLLTSASKNVDIATADAVRDFAAGTLESGIRTATLANDGVGLAPYHDWEERIPDTCKAAVDDARAAIIADPTLTGLKEE